MPVFLVGVGLPLTALALLIVAVVLHGQGLIWDSPIMLAIHSLNNSRLDIIAARVTFTGILGGVIPAAFVVGLILLWLKQWRKLTYLVITVLGTTLINYYTKLLFHRIRPSLWESFYGKPYDFSFPSGHAMFSMMFVLMLAILTYQTIWFRFVVIFGGLYVLAMAWTRIYLGVHFPSDIVGGWMIAIAWTIGISLIIKPNLGTQHSARGNS